MERSSVLPERQYSYRKGLGTRDSLLDIVCAGQAALYLGSQLALIQIDFSAAFDPVNYSGLLFMLRAAGVGGQVLSIIRCFLSDRVQSVKSIA